MKTAFLSANGSLHAIVGCLVLPAVIFGLWVYPSGMLAQQRGDRQEIERIIAKYARSIDAADTTLAAEIWSQSPDVSVIRIVRTAYCSPWRNGVAERCVGNCRRDLFDHVIVFNEAHLRRLVRDYIRYYHEDRTHDGLGKDTPNRRPIEQRKNRKAKLLSRPRLGGLHHRYQWTMDHRGLRISSILSNWSAFSEK